MGVSSTDLGVANTIVAAMAQPAALLDHAGVIQSCNDDFLKCVVRPARDIAGQHIAAVFGSQECADIIACLGGLRNGENSGQVSVVMPSGAFRLMFDQIAASGDGLCLCQVLPDHAIDSSRLRFLLEHLDHGVWNYNVASGLFTVTNAWRRMRGIGPDTDVNAISGWIEQVHPDDRIKLREIFGGQTSGIEQNISFEYRRKLPEGGWVWIACRASVMAHDPLGNPLQIVGLDTDITEIKENEAAITRLAGKMQLAIDVLRIGVWEFDAASKTVHWDDRLLEIYGLSDGMNNRPSALWETYLHPDDHAKTVAGANQSLNENRDFIQDFRIVLSTGEVRHIRSMSRFVQVAGTEGKAFGVNIDVTDDVRRAQELEKARAQLEYDSRHDALTGLANRRLLDEAMGALLAKTGPRDAFAVLHIDLDYFKQINDTLGHAAGDAVLVHVADTLGELIGSDGLVCRVGGDEFVILVRSASVARDMDALCQTIIAQMALPKTLHGEMCTVGLSIGYALGDASVVDASQVFINADVALYAAKSDGRSCYRAFSTDLRSISNQEGNSQQALKTALLRGQITCYLQPQFDVKTRKMIGAEALVRWNCPQRGMLGPDQFLPAAAVAGLVPRIDEYIFHHVLALQTAWDRAGFDVPVIALNISLERLQEDGLVYDVARALEPHHAISFELLETAFLDDATSALSQTLDSLRGLGVRLELDDFGSGHSSVVALQALRPDRVKIDRQLVAPISSNPTQIQTLAALMQLARLEGCDVVVEGLETAAQIAAVSQLECAVLQGYALARPMTIEAFETLLEVRAHQMQR